MQQRQLRIVSSCLVAAAAAVFIGSLHLAVTPAWAASAPERFGKTFAEIVSLAKKEGKVRFTSGTPDERQAKSFFKGFREKYPEINVEYTRATPRTASETILAELLSGQVEYDLVTVLDTLIPKYKKTGVLAGPFDWAGLFGIRGVYISPDRYFVGAGASTDVSTIQKWFRRSAFRGAGRIVSIRIGEGSSSSTAGAAVLSVCIPRGEKRNFSISPGAWRPISRFGSPVILTP